MRVKLRAETTNPTATLWARNCCTGNMGSSLRMLISNSDNMGQARDCGRITGITDSATRSATCSGTGQFFWIQQLQAGYMNVPELRVVGVPNSKVTGPEDLSTNQPCTHSSASHGTSCSVALDGDKRRDHPHEWHSYWGNGWMRVQLKYRTANPDVTLYARNCCTGNMGSSLRMYISDVDNLSQATNCGHITGIHDGSTNRAKCTGTGRYFWIHSTQAGYMNVPEITVVGAPI
jgi:hypothetical protein